MNRGRCDTERGSARKDGPAKHDPSHTQEALLCRPRHANSYTLLAWGCPDLCQPGSQPAARRQTQHIRGRAQPRQVAVLATARLRQQRQHAARCVGYARVLQITLRTVPAPWPTRHAPCPARQRGGAAPARGRTLPCFLCAVQMPAEHLRAHPVLCSPSATACTMVRSYHSQSLSVHPITLMYAHPAS